jgi:putative ABC transport system permease protein
MLKSYLKIAWRSIVRRRIYGIIHVLGLTLGISACLIIYLITRFELSYDNFHPNKDRIYRVVAEHRRPGEPARKMGFVVSPLPMTMRGELSGLETVSAFYNYYAKVTVPGPGAVRKFDEAKMGEQVSDIIVADPQYFELFRYQWLAGNPATALRQPFTVVLSEKEASKYFGSAPAEDAVGRQVVYNDSLVLTVTGIVRDWDKASDFGFRDFISLATVPHSFLKNSIDLNAWGMWDFDSQGFVKLAPGVSVAQVEKQFPAFVKRHVNLGPDPGHQVILSLQPLADIHFNEAYEDDYARKVHLPTLYGLMGIALFILVIAAINFINLSTAQSLQRNREIGIRKVLGGNRRSIILQFLTETFILTMLASLLSVLIAPSLLSALHNLVPPGVRLEWSHYATWIFLAAITGLTCLLAGFYPAKLLSGFPPVLNLKGQATKRADPKNYLQKSLIVFQFSFSLLFIIGTLVVGRQIHFIMNKDLGFSRDAVITLRTSYDYPPEKRELLAQQIRQMAGVQMVSLHMETPAAKGHPGTFIAYQDKEEKKAEASFDMSDTNYVPLFGLKIIAGRNLFPSDTIREFLVNETCAKQLGFYKPENALGKRVTIGMNNGGGPIVGIIRDFHSESLHQAITPFFVSSFRWGERDISVRLTTQNKGVGAFKTALAAIAEKWKAIYPNERFDYAFLDQTIARLYEKERRMSQLMSLAMGIAIFISCMGLLGLATFTAERRTKEIGVRKVLGAGVGNLVSLLTRDFVLLVLLAMLIAAPLAYYFMHAWLQDFAYRVSISPWIFVTAGLAAISITVLTVGFQAFRAAMANPVDSLRSE